VRAPIESLRLGRRGVESLVTVAVPLAVAALLVATAIPAWTTAGPFEKLADRARDSPIILGALLFVVLSAVARYWWGLARPTHRTVRPRGQRRGSLPFVAVVVGAAVAALVVRGFLFQPYRVIGGSMLPTLEPGDQLGVNRTGRRLGRAPRRGDIVGFEKTIDGRVEGLVKRVIGLPGDRVAMRGGHPIINDWPVPSCDAGRYYYLGPGGGVRASGRLAVEFLEDRVYLTTLTAASPPFDHYDVRPGEVFVVGDNRNESRDSRAWNDGRGAGLPLSSIVGVAVLHLGTMTRDGRPKLGPVRSLELRLGLEGLDRGELEAGIARCVAARPALTTPPVKRSDPAPSAVVQNSNSKL
jgi:signal peptidase I